MIVYTKKHPMFILFAAVLFGCQADLAIALFEGTASLILLFNSCWVFQHLDLLILSANKNSFRSVLQSGWHLSDLRWIASLWNFRVLQSLSHSLTLLFKTFTFTAISHDPIFRYWFLGVSGMVYDSRLYQALNLLLCYNSRSSHLHLQVQFLLKYIHNFL